MTTLANVTKLFSLVVILHLVVMSHTGADVAASRSEDDEGRGGRTIQNFSDISSKLLQIRGLLKQLFLDWNSVAVDGGESEIEGSAVGRTFGRIRLIRQMVLPITFFGGFLTAMIFGIAKTGIVNMLLIKAVLALQMLLIVGKLAYGAKELLSHKSTGHEIVYYPQPSPPVPHYTSYGSPPSSSYGAPPSSSYGWNRRQNQEEVFKDYNPSPLVFDHAAQYASPYNFVNNQQASLNRDYIQPSQAISRSIIKRSPDNHNESNLSSPNHRMAMATHPTEVLPLGQLIESRFTSQTNTQHQNHNHHQANYPNY